MSHHSSAKRRSLPFRDWPAPDQAAWMQATSPGTALLDAGAGAHWRDETRVRYRWSYGAWLAFLLAHSLFDPAAAPATRVTRDNALAFIEHLRSRGRAPMTIASYLQALHNVLWALAPEHDWSWLKKIVNFLVRNARPIRVHQSRIHPIDEVYAAALKLMDRADRLMPKRPLQDSIRYRDGLMVAVAAATALRRRNLALLDIDRHLLQQSDAWYLAIAGVEVKNHLPIEGTLPRSLTPYFNRYLEHHRPRLLQDRSSSRLWINKYGQPLSLNSFSGRLLEVTTWMGFPMRAHDFRRSAATTIAEVRPDLARIIGPFLVHASQHTSEQYYNKAQMLVSVRRHTQTVMALKDRLRRVDSDVP